MPTLMQAVRDKHSFKHSLQILDPNKRHLKEVKLSHLIASTELLLMINLREMAALEISYAAIKHSAQKMN